MSSWGGQVRPMQQPKESLREKVARIGAVMSREVADEIIALITEDAARRQREADLAYLNLGDEWYSRQHLAMQPLITGTPGVP